MKLRKLNLNSKFKNEKEDFKNEEAIQGGMDADLADRVGHDHGCHHRAHHHELHGPGPDVSPLLTIDY